MQSKNKIYLNDDDGDKFFGEGPCQLLHAIEETGSLHKATTSMHMAYTKATSIVKKAESVLGFSITTKTIGGKGGGGSRLTPEAKEFISDYEKYRDACNQANARIYNEIFHGKW